MPHRQNTQHQKSENFAQKRDGAVYQFNIAAAAEHGMPQKRRKRIFRAQILPFCFYLYSPFILNRLSPKINSTRHNQIRKRCFHLLLLSPFVIFDFMSKIGCGSA